MVLLIVGFRSVDKPVDREESHEKRRIDGSCVRMEFGTKRRGEVEIVVVGGIVVVVDDGGE